MTVYISQKSNFPDSAAFVSAAFSRAFGKPAPEILRTEKGKPYFESGPHFSVSHTGDVIVCVFSEDPVGVDCERVRPIDMRVMRRFLSSDESDPKAQTALWTRYESCGKRRGTGIPLTSPPDGGFATLEKDGLVITVNTAGKAQALELETL